MLFNNRYEIEINVDDILLDDYPVNYRFTMFDSVFNLYPKAKLTYNDFSGQFNEYLSFVNGTRISLKLGTADIQNIAPYIVLKNGVPTQPIQSKNAGIIEATLIHDYYYSQTKISSGYKDELSNIIKNKVNKYGKFTLVNIENTLNSGAIWYQPLLSDQDFFLKVLLPLAYSSSSNNTPFYMFIDSSNTFNFVSYTHMMNQSPVEELNLDSMGMTTGAMNNTILKLHTMQQGNLQLEELYHRNVFNFDSQGNFVSQEDFLTSYPSTSSDSIPVKKDLSLFTDNLSTYDDDISLTETVNLTSGLKSNSMRKGFHNEKIVVTLNINPKIIAGKTVTVKLPTGTDKNNNILGMRYSGKYIIESSYQVWNGINALTIAVLSRQTIKISKSYRNAKNILRPKS